MSAESGHFDSDHYWKNRDYHTSARLHLQHWLFQGTIEYLVHPKIAAQLKGRPCRIADLGCGNGAWLIALARQAPDSEFYGFDITASNFPAAAFLPKNVTLKVHDVFQGVPPELEGSFDLIHLRAMGTPIRGNPTPLLENISRMLSSEGWLQWDETHFSQKIAVSPNAETSKTACDQLLMIVKMGGERNGQTSTWVDTMDSTMSDLRFADASVDRVKPLPDHYKAWTEDYLIVFEEIGQLLPTAADAPPGTPLTREAYNGLFAKVVDETQAGVVMHDQEIMVAIGRKV